MRSNIRRAKDGITSAISAIDQELISLFIEAEKKEIEDVIEIFIKRNLVRIQAIDFDAFKLELSEIKKNFGLSGQAIKFRIQEDTFPFRITNDKQISTWDGAFDSMMKTLTKVKLVITKYLLDSPPHTVYITNASILKLLEERARLRDIFYSFQKEEDRQITKELVDSIPE